MRLACAVLCPIVCLFSLPALSAQDFELTFRTQSRVSPDDTEYRRVLGVDFWKARETAVIVCDVWDKHHSLNAVRRMEEFVPRIEALLVAARGRGATIIHAPSDCMAAYADHPARRKAMETPAATSTPPDVRYWCSQVPHEEQGDYPIDQSDGGDDDAPDEHAKWAAELQRLGRNPALPWQAQHPGLTIHPEADFISDRGDEVWNILESRGIRNVILVGVHTNMCVLGRPFGLRQMSRNGRNVVLVRDLTDCMYNPKQWPFVDHFTGNDLIVSHVERYVCPTITSDQILGGKPFRSAMDKRPEFDLQEIPRRADPGPDPTRFWVTVDAGDTWLRATDGIVTNTPTTAWYRSSVRLSSSWLSDGPLRFEVNGASSVEVWINGKPLAKTSHKPETFAIPGEIFLPDEINLVTMRIKSPESSQILPVSPAIASGNNRLKLQGRWQVRIGDDPTWSNIPLPAKFGLGSDVLFDPASESVRITAALEQQILKPEQSMEDVRRFSRSRISAPLQTQDPGEWQRWAESARQQTLDKVVFRGVAAEWRQAPAKVEVLDTIPGGPGYQIRKLRLEVIPDMWIPALLYLPDQPKTEMPVFLNVNGHDSAGKAADYKQARCIHMARQGIAALNLEWFGMGQLSTPGFSHARLNQLDLCGASGVAPFFLSMSRALDYLLSLEHADETRVGVAGLSGGGWQTIFISSLDPRVTLCNPVAGYSSFRTRIDNYSDLGDSEQTPVDLGMTADYSVLTTLLAPRAALLTYNEKDQCCFASGHALPPLMEAAVPVYELLGKRDHLRTHVNSDPGTHNFLLDNRQALYRMIRDQWFDGDETRFSTTEQPLDSEIKSREILDVPLPSMNLDLHSLAISISEKLPAESDSTSTLNQPAELANRIRETVKPASGSIAATEVHSTVQDGTKIISWKLQMGQDWILPATEFSRGRSDRTAILICDEGRKAGGHQVQSLLQQGYHVLAVDLFYFGECAMPHHAYLWALTVSTVGERPLGVQTGQLQSVCEWVRTRNATRPTGGSANPEPIRIIADGHRSSVIGLLTTYFELQHQQPVSLVEFNPLPSLRQVIAENRTFEQSPELFCFGLLRVVDLPLLRQSLSATNHLQNAPD